MAVLLNRIYKVLRVNHVSFTGVASVMDLVFPRGKDTIMNAFNDSVEKYSYSTFKRLKRLREKTVKSPELQTAPLHNDNLKNKS